MMDEDRFWEIIEESRRRALRDLRPRRDFTDLQIDALTELLGSLSPEEVVGFDRRFDEYHFLAYRWDLWGAAYWIGGGCGDDGFTDFRATLIGLGRELYFRSLDDPDSLSDLVGRPETPCSQYEGLQYVAGRVYEKLTGTREMPARGRRRGPAPHLPPEPQGEEWDFGDREEFRRRFPRLVARLPDMG